MADEKMTEGAEALDTVEEKIENDVDGVIDEAGEAVDAAGSAIDEALDAVDGVAETVVEEAQQVDEKVEAAVKHVAEEAEAQERETKRRERRSKQARAEKAAKAGATAADEPRAAQKAGGLKALGTGAWLGICAACLAVGLALGHFVIGGSSSTADLAGKTTVSEAELDDAYAVYTYNGQKYTISVREVIEQNGSVDAALTEDGTYTLPSAEYAINAARTAILNNEVEARGITVSDEDVTAYAEQNLGTSDYDAIASTYGMDAEAVKQLIAENCRLNALREEIVGTDVPTMPEAPTAAEEGKEEEATKEYADYIINLAGDEWDSDKGEWASKDGSYATALADYDVKADGATYTAAQTAYYVAYQLYTERQSEIGTQWSEFLNGLLSNANIQVGTLIS